MAAASAISRLVVYVMTCAALLQLRARFAGPEPQVSRGIAVNPPAFVAPGGPVVPVLAIVIAAGIIFGATRIQLISGAGALVAGAVLYLIAVRGGPRPVRGGPHQ